VPAIALDASRLAGFLSLTADGKWPEGFVLNAIGRK
jgi:hypothetical protein